MGDMDDYDSFCVYDFQSVLDCLDTRWNEDDCCYDDSPICFGCPFADQLTEILSF